MGKNFDSEPSHFVVLGPPRLNRHDAPATCRRLRIASLVPSLTELVFALGLGERLVARTGFCVHPSERVGAVAKVGGTKDVNLAKLRRLAPTHVLVNVDENRQETIDAIEAWGDEAPKIVVTHPRDPVDNLALVDQLATVVRRRAGPGRARRRAARRRWPTRWRRRRAAGPPEAARPLSDLARPVDDGGARHLPLAHARPHRLADAARRDRRLRRRGALPGARPADEPWLGRGRAGAAQLEPFAFQDAHHAAAAQALCPAARVRRVDGELLSWYGARAVAGLRYLRALADDEMRRRARRA